MVETLKNDFFLPNEPSAYELVNARGNSQVMLICDHASNRVPHCLNTLGLTASQLESHIGWDPGAADVARLLSKKLDAPLLLSRYSRLVIDCNRPLESDDSIPEKSAGNPIPANKNLSQKERNERIQHLFLPYHDAIENYLNERLQNHALKHIVVLLSVHSFTPFLFGIQRPWQIGISHKNDDRLAKLMINALAKNNDLTVGFNQPYAIEDAFDYSIPVHGDARHLPSIMIEIRQDEINTPKGVEDWADRIAESFRQIESEAYALMTL